MASAGSPPKAPDPNQVIQAQENANHYNTSNPFGSATWSRGADGRDSLNQSMSPQMQAMMNQAFSSAAAPRQQIQIPEGMSPLAQAIFSRVGARYGIGNGNANNPTIPGQANFPHGGSGTGQAVSLKGGAAPPPTGMGTPGGPSPMDQLQLQGNPGAQQGQMGGLGGLMGMQQGGMSGNPLSAMQALQGQNSPMGMPQVNMQQPGQMPLQRMGY